jgi:hypothetical protein
MSCTGVMLRKLVSLSSGTGKELVDRMSLVHMRGRTNVKLQIMSERHQKHRDVQGAGQKFVFRKQRMVPVTTTTRA